MRLEKHRPGRARASRRGRLNALAPQDVRDRSTGDLVPKIGKRALDARVSPAWVLTGHAHDKRLNCPHHARPARAFAPERPLHCDYLPVPAKQCVRRDDRIELKELFTAHSLLVPSKESAFSVRDDDPPTTETRLEQAILGLEVFDEPFLLPSEPRSECDDQKLDQRRRLNHGASLPELAASWLFDIDPVFGLQGRSPASSRTSRSTWHSSSCRRCTSHRRARKHRSRI